MVTIKWLLPSYHIFGHCFLRVCENRFSQPNLEWKFFLKIQPPIKQGISSHLLLHRWFNILPKGKFRKLSGPRWWRQIQFHIFQINHGLFKNLYRIIITVAEIFIQFELQIVRYLIHILEFQEFIAVHFQYSECHCGYDSFAVQKVNV